MSTPAADPARPGVSGRRELALVLGSLTALGPLSVDMYLPAFPTLSREFGVGPSVVQLTLTAGLVGLALGQIVMGPLSDSLGRRRPLLCAVVLYCASSLLCAAVPSIYLLIPLRLLQGASGSAGIVIGRAIVRDLYSGNDLARFFAMLMLVVGVAPIVAPTIGSQILRLTSWRGVFVVLAVMAAVVLVGAVTRLPETLPRSRRQVGGLATTARSIRSLVQDRTFVAYALCLGLGFSAMFSYISGSSFVLQDIYHLTPQQFGLAFGINGLGIVAAGQITGFTVHRFGPRRLLTAGLTLSAAGSTLFMVVLVTGLGLPGVLPAFFLVVSSMGLIFPNVAALALADHAHQAGTASSLLGLCQFMIGAAIAPLVGIAGTGTALPMGLVMIVLAWSSVLTYLVARRRQPAAPRPALVGGGATHATPGRP